MKRTSTTTEKTYEQFEIFVDLDRVLADFGRGIETIIREVHGEGHNYSQNKYERDPHFRNWMWDTCADYQDRGGELWYDLELMEDALVLWEYLEPFNPKILSATGATRFNAEDQKRRWVAEKLGSDVVVHLVDTAAQKSCHAAPGYILIDDKAKAIIPWENAGGTGVLHTSAKRSIRKLKRLGIC